MNFSIPKIGLRTIKTSISVFLCLFLFPNEPFFACLAAVSCLQNSVANSVKASINRIIGTIVGALYGLIFLIFCRYFKFNLENAFLGKLLIYLSIAIGIIFVIYTCNLIKKPGGINVSCIAFLAITTVHAYSEPIYYALNRIIETIFGVFIALLVNYFIFPIEKEQANNKNN